MTGPSTESPAMMSDSAQAGGLRVPPEAAEPLDISFSEDALSKLVRLFDAYGDIYRVYSPALQRHLYVLSHPDHAKHVLVANQVNYTKGVGIERVRILLGNGLMASEGEHWRSQRKMIQPAFHRTVIAQMLGHMHAANRRLLARWTEAAATGRPINLTQDMSEVTLEIVLRALFGERFQALVDEGDNPFAILTDETERNLTFAYRFRALSKLLLDEVERRRSDKLRGVDFLTMLLDARDRKTGAPMPDRQLLDEIMTLIVAGHETTASALNWTWYLLSQHPHVEQRLHAEIDARAATALDIDGLVQLPYTRQVVEETLRLYPPGWLLTRRSIAADAIGDYDIPPGTDVLISPYIVHRHRAFWRDPERFDPDRFAPSGEDPPSRFAYLPFGLGPRACIGEQFAMIEMQIHIASLARHIGLEFELREPVELEPQVNLRTRHPLYMIPHLRS